MAIKTRKKMRDEKIKKAYFEYWRLQNNVEYISFYKKVMGAGNKESFHRTLDELTVDQVENFRIGNPSKTTLVNPFKKIDWTYFKGGKTPDKYILLVMTIAQADDFYKPAYLVQMGKRRTPEEIQKYLYESRFIDVTIDLAFDKKEIIERVLSIIDSWRMTKEIKPRSRDSINKFHLHGETWDLRKGPERKTFTEIAKIMNTNTSTAKDRFYRAFELIYNKPYDPDKFMEARNTVHKETLKRTCDKCKERETCSTLCPDVISFVEQDVREKSYREVQPHEKDTRTRAHLGLEK